MFAVAPNIETAEPAKIAATVAAVNFLENELKELLENELKAIFSADFGVCFFMDFLFYYRGLL